MSQSSSSLLLGEVESKGSQYGVSPELESDSKSAAKSGFS